MVSCNERVASGSHLKVNKQKRKQSCDVDKEQPSNLAKCHCVHTVWCSIIASGCQGFCCSGSKKQQLTRATRKKITTINLALTLAPALTGIMAGLESGIAALLESGISGIVVLLESGIGCSRSKKDNQQRQQEVSKQNKQLVWQH